MARLFRPKPLRVVPKVPVPPIPLSWLVGDRPTRPGTREPERDALWVQLRAEIGRLLINHEELDPRRFLVASGYEHARLVDLQWTVLKRHFSDDARVIVNEPVT